MIMADVLKIFLIVLGMLIVMISYWLAAESLFPRRVGRARDRYLSQPIRVTLLGALVGGSLLAAGLGLLNAGSAPAKAVGFALASTAALAALLGSAGLCRRIGEGLPAPADAAQPWRRVLRGGVVLALTCLLPFAGWFLVLPLVLASGFGAALMAGWGLRAQAAAAGGPAPADTRPIPAAGREPIAGAS